MNRRMWINEKKQQCAKKFYLEMEQHALKAVWKFNQHPPWVAWTHWHADVSTWMACDLECPQFCSMSSTPSAMPSATTRRAHGIFSTNARQSDGNHPMPQPYVPRTLKPMLFQNTCSGIIPTPSSTASTSVSLSWLQKFPQTGSDVIKGSQEPLRTLVASVVGDAQDSS